MKEGEEKIRLRTIVALAEVKKYKKLGVPNARFTDEMRSKSAKALREIADNNENNIKAIPVIKTMMQEGKTLQAIADHLNANAFKTSKGCEFTRMAVSRLAKR